MSKETLRKRIATLEARNAGKPLGPMAQADLDHARAALRAFGSERKIAAATNAAAKKKPGAKMKARAPKKRLIPIQVRSIVSGGLPGLGKRA